MLPEGGGGDTGRGLRDADLSWLVPCLPNLVPQEVGG